MQIINLKAWYHCARHYTQLNNPGTTIMSKIIQSSLNHSIIPYVKFDI